MAIPIQFGVDPANIPKKMTRPQLEWWILFGIMVAGKNAKSTEKKLNELLDLLHTMYPHVRWPFDLVSIAYKYKTLDLALMKVKTGKYKLLSKGFKSAIEHLNLKMWRDLTIHELEAVHGIGPKTARMILLYSGQRCNGIPIDTHMLKYLRLMGIKNVPKTTPGSKKEYKRLEDILIKEARELGISLRDFDTAVWKHYAKH